MSILRGQGRNDKKKQAPLVGGAYVGNEKTSSYCVQQVSNEQTLPKLVFSLNQANL